MDGTILVADDDRTIRTVLTQALTRAGCKVRSTGSLNTLWRWVEEGEGNVVVSDVMLPDGDGLELLPAIKKKRPDLPVIVISAQNTMMTAIKASETGAYDYLPKPFDLKELLSKVNKALNSSGNTKPNNPVNTNETTDIPLVGSTPVMQDVYRLLARVINTDLSVLISGESGTGKDLLAKSLHDLGHRRAKPFIAINAPTLTPSKIAELFFDGSGQESQSQAPDGATLYFDEISELSEEAQKHLLDNLRDERVKSKNYRILASTRSNLAEQVNTGSFREDLFYRLNVVPMTLPPLRDRMNDVGPLAKHFLEKASVNGAPQKILSKAALDLMKTGVWAGNVRELENFVNRLVILTAEEEITAENVKQEMDATPSRKPDAEPLSGERLSTSVEAHIQRYFDLHGDHLPPPGLYQRILREVEMPLIALSLAATRGNQIKTAELLGINRNTLRKKIQDLDIQVTRGKKMM